jgi:hypothetical protein
MIQSEVSGGEIRHIPGRGQSDDRPEVKRRRDRAEHLLSDAGLNSSLYKTRCRFQQERRYRILITTSETCSPQVRSVHRLTIADRVQVHRQPKAIVSPSLGSSKTPYKRDNHRLATGSAPVVLLADSSIPCQTL